MALNASNTASDITAAIVARRTARGQSTSSEEETLIEETWADIIGALYSRIKADMVVTTKIASGQTVTAVGSDPQGGTVASNGSNNTDWTGVANGSGSGSIA